MQKSTFEEQANLLRAELRGLVATQLKEMAESQLERMEFVQGLMERLGILLERTEVAVERLSMVPAVVQMAPAPPPPLAGLNVGTADSGLELFGWDVTNSASMVALTSMPLVLRSASLRWCRSCPNRRSLLWSLLYLWLWRI